MASTLILLACLAVATLAVPARHEHGNAELSKANAGFSQRLYQKIAVGKSEAVYSPYSIHSALSMTALGARGQTASEMYSTLGLTSMAAGPDNAYHDLIVRLNSAKDVQLYTGNGIFTNPSFNIVPSFVTDVQNKYFAKAEAFDMNAAGGPEKPINDFIERNTHDMIKNVVKSNSITSDTVMLLVNTLFFKGNWAENFDVYKTQKKPFHQLGGARSQVDMMKDERHVNFKSDNSLKADMVRIPFKGGRFSLYVVLPQSVDGITALETSLTSGDAINKLFDGLEPKYASLEIPKFRIESSFQLKDQLKALGMVKAFDAKAANFSGITPAKETYISSVIHQAMIEVKETGTTAAATTAVSIEATSLLVPPPDMVYFRADHPFLFFLRDDQTKQILFQGKFSG
ncbi:serpin B3 [Aplysia californica]|uniref:Serpin B3 n=1 Tax=Aplysia californica TaxID=6500 RepID=A0ABM1VX31_APLCA|nr:serpin B3 [Aplysia californica]